MAATRVNTQDIFDGGVKVNDIGAAAVTFPKLNLAATPGIINDGADGIRAQASHKLNFLTSTAPSVNNQILTINSTGTTLDWLQGADAYPVDEAKGIVNTTVSGLRSIAMNPLTDGGIDFDSTSGQGQCYVRSRVKRSGAPASPADGDSWYDTANGSEYFRASAIVHGISASGNSTIANSSAIANTTTETVFSGGTYNVPVGYARARRVVRLTAWGFYSTTGTPNLQFRIRADTGLTLSPAQGGNLVTISNASARVWMVRSTMIVNVGGASGNISGLIESSVDNNVLNVRTGFVSVDWTSTKQFSLTATWGTASASNTVTMERSLWEILN